jgi:isoquinoline 1-oxidoreductase beta subunit
VRAAIHTPRPRHEEAIMNNVPQMTAAPFLSPSLPQARAALGLKLPFGGPDIVRAADDSPEVNAWL